LFIPLLVCLRSYPGHVSHNLVFLHLERRIEAPKSILSKSVLHSMHYAFTYNAFQAPQDCPRGAYRTSVTVMRFCNILPEQDNPGRIRSGLFVAMQ